MIKRRTEDLARLSQRHYKSKIISANFCILICLMLIRLKKLNLWLRHYKRHYPGIFPVFATTYIKISSKFYVFFNQNAKVGLALIHPDGINY